jgi:hypothetical protein
MYRLLNKIFGWDYIYWQNSADSGVDRIHKTKDGTVFFWRYGKYLSKLDDKSLLNDKSFSKIVWLTCSKEKYIKSDNKGITDDTNNI